MKHYTVSELANAIQTSPQYIRQELKSERMKGSKVGSFWIIPEDEVANQIAKRMNKDDGINDGEI